MDDATTRHRYPPRAQRAAWIRIGIGILVGAGLGVASHGIIAMSVISVTILLIFLAYGLSTYVRGTSTVIVDADGLRVTGLRPVALAWQELTGLHLAYYTTRRDGENGWMELSVRGPGGRISLDSDIDGFDHIVTRSMAAAKAAGVELTPATLRNFDVLATDGPAGGVGGLPR